MRRRKKGSVLWKYWFPNINSNKANIFLDRISGEEERKHIYSVVKTDSDTLKACAELCESENRSMLIAKLHELIEQEKARNARMNHLLIIGKHIEEALKDNIEKGIVAVDKINKNRFQGYTDEELQKMKDNHDIRYFRVPLTLGGIDSVASAEGLVNLFKKKCANLSPKHIIKNIKNQFNEL